MKFAIFKYLLDFLLGLALLVAAYYILGGI